MMWSYLICVLILIPAFNCEESDYYWADYTSTIPENAFEAGLDTDGNSIYIGKKTEQSLDTIIQIPSQNNSDTNNIKILCNAPRSMLFWERAKGENLHVDLIKLTPIIGGKDAEGVVYIGRVFYQDGIKIGPISGYKINEAPLTFIYRGQPQTTKLYEILTLDEPRGGRRPPGGPRPPGSPRHQPRRH